MQALRRFMGLVLVLLGLIFTSYAYAQEVKVVYHISTGLNKATGTDEASRAMTNIRYHLEAAPKTKIVVVANGDGVNFLLEGAQTSRGQPFSGIIGDLAGQGVEFRVCNKTLESFNIAKDKVALEASVVPSGTAEVARLQFSEGYAYIKP